MKTRCEDEAVVLSSPSKLELPRVALELELSCHVFANTMGRRGLVSSSSAAAAAAGPVAGTVEALKGAGGG